MSTTITGIVTNGVVVTKTMLPEGTCVEIRLMADGVRRENPLLHFKGHRDPNDPLEQEFVAEMARLRREDYERTIREDEQECSNSSLTPTT